MINQDDNQKNQDTQDSQNTQSVDAAHLEDDISIRLRNEQMDRTTTTHKVQLHRGDNKKNQPAKNTTNQTRQVSDCERDHEINRLKNQINKLKKNNNRLEKSFYRLKKTNKYLMRDIYNKRTRYNRILSQTFPLGSRTEFYTRQEP